MSKNPKLSILSLAIMGLVAQQSCSGYDIRKIFATTPMGSFSSSPGAIYPALKRLERTGWITGVIEDPGSLRPRQVFSLSVTGKKVLRDHLLQPVTHEDMVWRIDELILRFAFMEHVVGRDATVSFLQEYQRESQAYVEELKQILEAMKEQMNTSSRLALEHGIQQYQMNADWAEQGLREYDLA